MIEYIKTNKSRLFLEELDQETKDIFEKCIQECVSTKNDCIKKHPKIINKVRLIGFLKKIKGSPKEIIKDILNCSSKIFPRINAKIMGKIG